MNTDQKAKKKIYVAGPLFTAGDRTYLEQIDQVCQDAGFSTYLPHRDAGLCIASDDSGALCFQSDKVQLDEVDMVVAVLNGNDVDSGTAWELGYAYGRSLPIFGIYDDKRIQNPKAYFNPMIYYSLELCTSLEDLQAKLAYYAG